MNQKKHWLSWLLILMLVVTSNITTTLAQTLSGFDYAPFVNYLNYTFEGEGNEFAGMNVTLQYGVDAEGYYQFVIDNTGTSMAYVYRITDEGIYEEAFFPESYEGEDYRHHQDARDDIRSLVLPAEVAIGQTFYRGYKQELEMTIIDILPEMKLGSDTYYNVLVVEGRTEATHDNPATTQRYYYAPGIGLILDEFEMYDDSGADPYVVTSTLSCFSGMSQYSVQ